MRNKFISTCLAFIALWTISVTWATPPNTTAVNSVPYEVGQGWVTHYFDEIIQTRWFRYGEVGGRSYCVEAVQGSVSPILLDPNLALFTDLTGATPLVASGVILANNDGAGEPFLVKGSRICYIAPGSFGVATIRTAKLNLPIAATSGDAGNVRLRIVETTLVAPSVQSKQVYGYQSLNWDISVENLTNSELLIRVTRSNGVNIPIYDSDGSGSLTDAVLPHSTMWAQSSYYSGAILIAHNGTPSAIRAVQNQYRTSGTTTTVTSIELRTR